MSVVNTNMSSLTSQRYLGVNNRNAETAMSRLSSGLRINSAKDDAAGLAISQKMRGQIRGLDMAKKNAQDSTSLLQVAEGGLDQVHSILERMRELAVQSANDTNTNDDRTELESELRQLKKEIDRIGNTTEFNTKKLLEGSMQGATDEIRGRLDINNNSAVSFTETSLQNLLNAVYGSCAYDGTITIIRNAVDGVLLSQAGFTSTGDNRGTQDTPFYTSVGDVTWKIIFANDKNAQGDLTAVIGYGSTGGQIGAGTNGGTRGQQVTHEVTIHDGSAISLDVTINARTIVIEGLDGANGTITLSLEGNINMTDLDVGDSISFNFSRNQQADGTLGNSFMTQLGANTGQLMYASISDMRSEALGLRFTSVATNEQAQAAITEVDNAVALVNRQRSLIGAIQNRLEYAINALEITSENVTAAESRIRDTDMAKEMSNYTKENIKSQAAQTMVAQANARAQNVLALLQ